jgi:predicted RNA-binding protein with PIN domain
LSTIHKWLQPKTQNSFRNKRNDQIKSDVSDLKKVWSMFEESWGRTTAKGMNAQEVDSLNGHTKNKASKISKPTATERAIRERLWGSTIHQGRGCRVTDLTM